MADRILTSSATVTIDESVPGQIKFDVVAVGASNIVVTDNAGIPITDSDDEEVTL